MVRKAILSHAHYYSTVFLILFSGGASPLSQYIMSMCPALVPSIAIIVYNVIVMPCELEQ